MKIIYALVIVLVMASTAFSADSGLNASFTSGNKTADAVISARPAVAKLVAIITDGSNDCSVALYNNASAATGTVAWPALPCPAASKGCAMPIDVFMSNGIYADMTVGSGGTCTYNIHYR